MFTKAEYFPILLTVNDQTGSRDNNVSIDCEVTEMSTKKKSVSSKVTETDSVSVVYLNNDGRNNHEERAAAACLKESGTYAKSYVTDQTVKESQNQPTNTFSNLQGRIKEQKEGASGKRAPTKAKEREGEIIADDVYLEGITFTKLPFVTYRSR